VNEEAAQQVARDIGGLACPCDITSTGSACHALVDDKLPQVPAWRA
jgi:hypothetical protein